MSSLGKSLQDLVLLQCIAAGEKAVQSDVLSRPLGHTASLRGCPRPHHDMGYVDVVQFLRPLSRVFG